MNYIYKFDKFNFNTAQNIWVKSQCIVYKNNIYLTCVKDETTIQRKNVAQLIFIYYTLCPLTEEHSNVAFNNLKCF